MEKEDSFQTLAGAFFPTTIMVFCRSRVAATVKQSKINTLKTIILLYSLDSGVLKNVRIYSCPSELRSELLFNNLGNCYLYLLSIRSGTQCTLIFTIQGNSQRLFNVQGCGLENLNKIKIQMDICLETQSFSPGVFLLKKFYLKSDLTNYIGILHDAL